MPGPAANITGWGLAASCAAAGACWMITVGASFRFFDLHSILPRHASSPCCVDTGRLVSRSSRQGVAYGAARHINNGLLARSCAQ